ncbi:MAG: hypothetical protein LRY71_08805 [Bacillaceae bacterium]|nr:hypothetical protein [Bacillaceae bacterium]
MEKWLEEWRRRYQTLKSAIENNQYNEKLYTELANECEQLLQTWMEMEDNLDDLKDLKEENSEPNVTEIKQMKTEGITYFDLEMFPKAIEVLKQELNEIDESLEASHHLFIGFANLYEANLDLSKESFLYVAHSSESTIEKHFAYFGLGCLYGRLRQYDEAISFF